MINWKRWLKAPSTWSICMLSVVQAILDPSLHYSFGPNADWANYFAEYLPRIYPFPEPTRSKIGWLNTLTPPPNPTRTFLTWASSTIRVRPNANWRNSTSYFAWAAYTPVVWILISLTSSNPSIPSLSIPPPPKLHQLLIFTQQTANNGLFPLSSLLFCISFIHCSLSHYIIVYISRFPYPWLVWRRVSTRNVTHSFSPEMLPVPLSYSSFLYVSLHFCIPPKQFAQFLQIFDTFRCFC